MLWPPWETVPECSPQIQAWDYLGGYCIRCRGNFGDSKLSEPLGFGWTRLLAGHCLRRVLLYTEEPLRASPLTLNSHKINGLHRFRCSPFFSIVILAQRRIPSCIVPRSLSQHFN